MSLAAQVELIRSLQGAFLDAWVVVDTQGTIVAFNRAFFTVFPRRIARKLEGTVLEEVLEFTFSEASLHPAAECLERGTNVRYDEVEGCYDGGDTLNFIVCATPLGPADARTGALVVLRNVTDEAAIQSKYRDMIGEESDERADLRDVLARRTRELLAANDQLNTMQEELVAYRSGLLLPGSDAEATTTSGLD